jgi:GNAT superfamily N-acetyltransferase
MNVDQPLLRTGTPEDAPRIDALMKESIAALFPLFYNEQQTASAVRYVAQVDPALLEDGTYFVVESGDEVIGCGGWSRRDKLYTGSGDSSGDERVLDPSREPARVRAMFVRADWTRRGLGRRILEECETAAQREGFRRLTLGATLPGVPLYAAYGFEPYREGEITMPDGIALACVWMEKPIDDTRAIRTGGSSARSHEATAGTEEEA